MERRIRGAPAAQCQRRREVEVDDVRGVLTQDLLRVLVMKSASTFVEQIADCGLVRHGLALLQARPGRPRDGLSRPWHRSMRTAAAGQPCRGRRG